MYNYPDILITSNRNWNISDETIRSIEKYAPYSYTHKYFSVDLDWDKGNTLLAFRNEVFKGSKSDWIIFLDSDDELNMTIPSNNELNGYLVHMYSMKYKDSNINIYNTYVSKYFGFHMLIMYKDIVKKIFDKLMVLNNVYRDDIAFLYYVLLMTNNISFHLDEVLMKKNEDRLPNILSRELRLDFIGEVYEWIIKFSQLPNFSVKQ